MHHHDDNPFMHDYVLSPVVATGYGTLCRLAVVKTRYQGL